MAKKPRLAGKISRSEQGRWETRKTYIFCTGSPLVELHDGSGTTMVASWAFRLQFHEVVCTHYSAEFVCRVDGKVDGDMRVVPSIMNFVTQPWAAAEGRRERTGERANTMERIEERTNRSGDVPRPGLSRCVAFEFMIHFCLQYSHIVPILFLPPYISFNCRQRIKYFCILETATTGSHLE